MDNKSTSEVKPGNKSTHKLGFFGFFAITASMVMTVYEYLLIFIYYSPIIHAIGHRPLIMHSTVG